MYVFFENCMRDGASYISKTYSKPNNKYLKSYDPIKSYHILSTNDFSGYTMFKLLPASGFKWLDPKKFDLNKYSSNSSKLSVLEVDLEYPKELEGTDTQWLPFSSK